MKTNLLKLFTVSVILIVTFLSAWSIKRALHIPMTYSAEQFLPQGHQLILNDFANKKLFDLPEYSPEILVINERRKIQSFLHGDQLKKLQMLTKDIERLRNVELVMGLGNVQTALTKDKELMFGTINDLRKEGLTNEKILSSPLFVPSLLSEDANSTAILIMPKDVAINRQKILTMRIVGMARKYFPDAQVSMGGSSPIRTELLSLLSREIMIFLALSLIAALLVLKAMFHGWSLLWKVCAILTASNLISLGVISLLHFTFNMLSSTLSILVTACCLGIVTRTLVRMGKLQQDGFEDRKVALLLLMRELWIPHVLAAFTTAIGFATLIPSDVPLISQYGLGVTVGVCVGAAVTLLMIPAFYLWTPWPRPRKWLGNRRGFAIWMIRHNWQINAGVALIVVLFSIIGTQISWTARLFDDLPSQNTARRATDFIGRRLGGSVNMDVIIAMKQAAPWKSPRRLKALERLAKKWRKNGSVGSVITVADFIEAAGDGLPMTKKSVAEIQFLFNMSSNNPLKNYLSSDEHSTRVAFRFPDLPSDQMEDVANDIESDLRTAFPTADIQFSGMGAVVPKVNRELSKKLMWGFFDAMFWIVLMLTLMFRSIRWALVAAIPNFVPPILLMGFLALFKVPIKPGIAIIFSISLGLAFDNTVYVLERLKYLMKNRTNERLPIGRVVAEETNPCLVSSLCLFVGFSIFLFSYFPVNKMFGAFMLISIAAGLLGDLVWLPSLIQRFPWLLLGQPKDATLLGRRKWTESAMRISPYALLVLLGLVSAFGAHAADLSAEDILKQVEIRSSPPQEAVQMRMITTDGSSSKERWMTIIRKNGKEHKALVRLQKPADLKGLALLSVNSQTKEDQWLYLPSAKKTRRILGSNSKGKFLDSEIAYEDLKASAYKQFVNKVTSRNADMVEIESTAKKGSDSSYSRMKSYVAIPDYRLVKIQYWDEHGKPLKTAEFKGYQKIGDKYWRAKTMEVVNSQNKRKTTLELKKVSLKNVNDDDLSVAALEEN
jgi:predicted RND superfamily exporter protein